MLYRLVAGHLETFLAQAGEACERGLPRYIERELRAYLACGIHAHGFIRTRCSDCHKELLVAFSCKRRGVCPSCNARRMCGTAAHLTDRVLPDVPLRQWVLGVPFELRLLLAKNAAALSATGRIFVQEILRWQREQAHASLPDPALHSPSQYRGGALCFPQRFGGSLNLNVHYHVAVPDGVFTRCPSRGAKLHRLPLPNRGDLEGITHAVELRVLRWLRRRGLLGDTPVAEEKERESALDDCLQSSLGVGELVELQPRHAISAANDSLAPAAPTRAPPHRSKSARGFDIHAAVSVAAGDREGRERLLRYCARAPLSLQRLTVMEDGRVAYRIKSPRGKRTHRVMTPVQFLARLCALIPPPRHPLVRFHGVFAPHSSWRRDVVALVDRHPPARPAHPQAHRHEAPEAPGARVTLGRPASAPAPATTAEHDPVSRHSRIDWATLLQRTYDIDALACPCGGRLRVLALITEPEIASAILTALHLPVVPPPLARARAPDDYEPPYP